MSTTATLLDGHAARLAWNLEPDAFVFHYTTPSAAQTIHRTGFYAVGPRRAERAGMYVTRIQPGAATSERLLNLLFDGTRDLERTRAVVVLRHDAIDVQLERDTRDAWRYAAAPHTTLDLRDALVGWAADIGDGWRYDPNLFA